MIFTSPNKDAYHDFSKEDLFKDTPLYMPLWKTEELEAAARMLGINPTANKF
jgi:hypothetical protein